MDSKQLEELGLSHKQASTYLCLLQNGATSAPDLMKLIDETRTNTYMILDSLVSLGVVSKQKQGGRNVFSAQSPLALRNISNSLKQRQIELDAKIEGALPEMMRHFHSLSEKPGAIVLEGRDGLEQIYEDTIKTGQDVYLLRSRYDDKYMGLDFYMDYIKRRAAAGIHTEGYYPNQSKDSTWIKDIEELNITPHFYDHDRYDEPVEISVYGDKVAFLSFGKEIMGLIIESPIIAAAIKSIIRSF